MSLAFDTMIGGGMEETELYYVAHQVLADEPDTVRAIWLADAVERGVS